MRAVDAATWNCRIQAVVMNTFHLMQRPGSSPSRRLGGLHRMSGWPRPIITDSGGFQAYSLIRQNPKFGSMSDRGITFQPEGSDRKFQLTPEKSVQLQIGYGADVVICLDDCTHVDASRGRAGTIGEAHHRLGQALQSEFDRIAGTEKADPTNNVRSCLAVIQGGGELDLRKRCADALLEIGFDGFGFGGWPLDGQGNLLADMLAYMRELIPPQFPMHALGVGHPQNVLACLRSGLRHL